MADLSITQIMQEHVPERERGTVFGVQNAFCQLFSVSKDLVVLALPDSRTFGYLIIMSVAFVVGGFLNFLYYLLKVILFGFLGTTKVIEILRVSR
jgi:iron-regulated transporter 1